MNSVLETAQSPDLHVQLLRADDRLRMIFGGRAETDERSVHSAFLAASDAHVSRLKVSEVDVDVRTLEFMVSSCFKEFVVWVSKVKAKPRAQPRPRRRLHRDG